MADIEFRTATTRSITQVKSALEVEIKSRLPGERIKKFWEGDVFRLVGMGADGRIEVVDGEIRAHATHAHHHAAMGMAHALGCGRGGHQRRAKKAKRHRGNAKLAQNHRLELRSKDSRCPKDGAKSQKFRSAALVF